jgi:diguanylate cyclase (GGDEF)-like protein
MEMEKESTAVENLLKNDVRLPSPPAIAVRILEVVRREDFSFLELAQVIQTDPALTGRILRVANSSFYSLSRNVTTIETAIAVLGVNAAKNIALSFILRQAFPRPQGERFDLDRLWRRSITAAVAAQLISKAIGFKNDETFIASLLQDIGIAALFALRKDQYFEVLDEKAVTGLPVAEVERRVFGFDHQEVGAELLKFWGLPESVYLPIRYHHRVDSAPDAIRPLCRVLWASDRLSAIYHGAASVKNFLKSKEILTKQFRLDDEGAGALIDAVAERSGELMSQFNCDQSNILPFSEILQLANDELSRINRSYDMLLLEYKEAVRRAERLASELKLANEKLRHAAFHDNLTGTYNRQYFQEALEREMQRAQRYRHPLSVIMFDIDSFKRINDTYGHHTGDAVIRAVGQMVLQNSRRSDIVVRYGGEEFAILLPETGLASAIAKAESCRATVAATDVEADGHVIRVTISLGVATFSPTQRLSPDDFIRGADQALYLSKRNGRNQTTVWDWEAVTASPRR